MRKKLKALLLALIISSYPLSINGQTQPEFNFGDMPKPVPSVSSLSTYTDTPVSLSLGIPEISLPLTEVPLRKGSIPVVLSYSPMNVSEKEPASETGMGWSLFLGGVISREIVKGVDEIYQLNNSDYQKNEFDDIYYYNLPGLAGKFKIKRDVVQNTFSLIDMTPQNHIKIEYTRDNSNQLTLLLNSFTITDDQGNQYLFNDFSTSTLYDGIPANMTYWGMDYKSAFFLTQIKDASNIEIANFTYRKDTKTENGQFLYQTCKLENVNSASGNLHMEYDYNAAYENMMTDPYSIKSVTLNNSYTTTAAYHFDYNYINQTYENKTHKKRMLTAIRKMKGTTELEKISFFYYSNGLDNNSNACNGTANETYNPENVLKSIVYPGQGTTTYTYERNEVYSNKSAPDYLESINDDFNDSCAQYKNEFSRFNFNTAQTRTYNFTITGDPSKKKAYWINYTDYYTAIDPETGETILLPSPPDNKRIKYNLKKGNETVVHDGIKANNYFYNYPGQYTITIIVPQQDGTVRFWLDELLNYPGPYRNSKIADGYRIRSISNSDGSSSALPAKTMSYSYDQFSTVNSSSGESYRDVIYYRNVVVSSGKGNGYTRYYFNTPQDYPSIHPYVTDGNSTATFQPNYNLLSSGLLKKKEIYNYAHQLLTQEDYDYTFQNVSDLDYEIKPGLFSKTTMISKSIKTDSAYPKADQNKLQSITETTYNPINLKVSGVKSTGADGQLMETQYRYAADLSNTTGLITANMTGILLESTTQRNSKNLATKQVKYANAGSLLPSSETSLNPNDSVTDSMVRYDHYDDKANIVQYTTHIDPLYGSGFPVTIIWGYNKTLPIAKIEGAKLSDIGSLADDIVTKSNADTSEAQEQLLIEALDLFRDRPELKGYFITTYTHDPLIGMTTITPSDGIREYYHYDDYGRLEKVTNANGHIIKEMKYHQKP